MRGDETTTYSVDILFRYAFKAWQQGRGFSMEKWFLPVFLIPQPARETAALAHTLYYRHDGNLRDAPRELCDQHALDS